MRGFTLLESLVYIALFGLVMTGTVTGFAALTESSERNQTKSLLETEGNFLIGKITYEIEHAQSIGNPSEHMPSGNELDLISDSGSAVQITNASGTLIQTENANPLPLSSNSVQMTQVEFIYLPIGTGISTSSQIQTTFEISATSSTGQLLSESFSTTSYIFP